MAQVELIMPKMGESVAEATIIKWLKEEGDKIEMEESVLEIATDKVDSEVPAPADGVLKKKLFGEDDVVKVGEAIAIIETEADAAGDDAPSDNGVSGESQQEKTETEEYAEEAGELVSVGQSTASEAIPRTSGGNFYSPLVRNIAEQEGVSVQELDNLDGSGADGRVTKQDILNYIETRGDSQKPPQQDYRKAPQISAKESSQKEEKKIEQKAASSSQSTQVQTISAPAVSIGKGDEIIEMDRMRKKIAEHMVMSKHVSPHVTSFVEADVTNLWNWRNKAKKIFQERENEKLTFTPLFIEAVVKAIKDFPMVNVSVNGDQIIKRKNINIGMAAALPSGNLIVPVIHNADQLNLVGLTTKVNDLANRARNGELKPDEISGGTYTLTNVGTFGNVMGTPIINQPQVAILATGSINKKPAVIETPEGDFIGIRYKMFLSHSYDHRVVDGALGGQFVKRVAEYLEDFNLEREV